MTDNSPRKERTRGNRDGRPFQRASDGLWVATVYLPNGKRKPVYGKTRKEAADKKKKAEAEISAGLPVTAGRTDTVEHYLTKVWLAVTLPQRVAAGRIAPSTLDSYQDTAEKHIIPHLGRVKLVELSTTDIRRWLLELADKPSGRVRRKLRPGETELPPPPKLSARTVAYSHAVLRKALADAVDDESLGRNVCLLVDAPAVEREEVQPLTKQEAGQLLAEAAGDPLWVYWLMLLALGLRRGEGLGMRWSHIDLEAGTVRLVKSIQRLRGEKDEATGRRKGQLVEKKLKTRASKATMLIPATALQALAVHRRAQNAERLRAKVWADPDLVFTTGVGTALEPRNVNRSWDALCERAGIGRRVRLHDLRHACGSFLFAEGADLKTIQGVLRHTRQATTANVYVHLLEEVKRGAADTLDGVLADLTAPRAKREKSAS
ncbi:tyrosine-type recombinase/integrase [Streptosporangium carneum]|uniref:Site-specific integrase n=1 Tax=Streptosporangium carneum TaxID=47481 RepID=A0A9W6HWT9_9ACTN|nr:tyrosine-type recombinase/integrase [Streptosporangium carneum]GLK07251.1 site-specific integrase [Streptosporangium carneum]